MKKFRMMIVPIEEDTYFECEAEDEKEAEAIGQDYANNNFCYVARDIEEIEDE